MSFSADLGNRDERAARNQSLFHALNKGVARLNQTLLATPFGEWICECANTACVEKVEMSQDEYEAVQRDGARFVAPSDEHVCPDIDHVTNDNDRYWIVQTIGTVIQHTRNVKPRAHEPLPLRT